MEINSQIKSRSITSKASSACKINMGLVQGAADIGNSKAFVDYGTITEKKETEKETETETKTED